MRTFGKLWVVTHTRNLVEIACQVYPQNLDCDLATLMFSRPHISVPAAVQWLLRSIKAKRDLKRTRKQSVVTTYPVQCIQTLLLQPRSQALQCLLGMRSGQ